MVCTAVSFCYCNSHLYTQTTVSSSTCCSMVRARPTHKNAILGRERLWIADQLSHQSDLWWHHNLLTDQLSVWTHQSDLWWHHNLLTDYKLTSDLHHKSTELSADTDAGHKWIAVLAYYLYMNTSHSQRLCSPLKPIGPRYRDDVILCNCTKTHWRIWSRQRAE